MFDLLYKPLRRLARKSFKGKKLNGFYRVKIVNRSNQVIWLAKNTVGDLHDIIPPGRNLEIRIPLARTIEFYAYKADSNLAVSGLNYVAKKEFNQDDVWVIH